jgi:hypothetical protein
VEKWLKNHKILIISLYTDEGRLEILISGSSFGTVGFSPRRGGGYLPSETQDLFFPDGTFYAPDEPREKMKKCTEWTEEQAIPVLYASGVLLRNT